MSLKYSRELNSNDVKFKIPKTGKKINILNGINIEMSYFKNFKKLKSYDKNISVILDRTISKTKKTVITTGEIVKSFTFRK